MLSKRNAESPFRSLQWLYSCWTRMDYISILEAENGDVCPLISENWRCFLHNARRNMPNVLREAYFSTHAFSAEFVTWIKLSSVHTIDESRASLRYWFSKIFWIIVRIICRLFRCEKIVALSVSLLHAYEGRIKNIQLKLSGKQSNNSINRC